MNCKETEKHIVHFIQNDLEDYELEEFVKHTMKCNSCMEELSIQYLVSEGMNRIESGGNFDLSGELNIKLAQSLSRVRLRKRLNALWFACEILFIIGIAIAAVVILF